LRKGKNNAKTGSVLWFSPAHRTGLLISYPFGAIFGQCQKERDIKSPNPVSRSSKGA